ncbi:MAG: NAD-dependent epimerase/dehydratase family protein [Candidatus Aenigmatarchaeota archaeon]
MKILITGGAGFIGSHLVDVLLKNNEIIVLDNLSTGKKENIQHNLTNSKFKFFKVDIVKDSIDSYFKNVEEVWHLAANPDVRAALKNTKIDIEQNFLATYNVLEAMRKNDVKKIYFTSSSTVYGLAKKIPTPENSPLEPISLYGATKLACEALISAYCNTFGFKSVIFRLANVIGPRSSHGVIFDFFNKLKKNPNELEILGNGKQKKSYIYISDCIDAMLIGARKSSKKLEIFNIGSEDWITVKEIAEIVCEKMNLKPKFKFTGGKAGWKGDVHLMLLDVNKIKRLGWEQKVSIKEAIERTVNFYKGLKC